MVEVRVRGALVTRQRTYMEQLAGPAHVAAAVDALPPDRRHLYDEATLLSWVPQGTVRDVTRGVAERLGISGVELAERVVDASVYDLCRGPWNILLRMTDDEALISRSAAIFARAFDAGRLRVTREGPGIFDVVLNGWPGVDDMDLASISAGIKATLRSVGRSARVDRTRTPDGARYRVLVL
jgi:hypothetical protein